MSLQRRLAIVPGSDVLSPKEAQRILHEHQRSDYSSSWEDKPKHLQGRGQGSNHRRFRELRLQIPQRSRNLDLTGGNMRHDERETGAATRRNSKQDVDFKRGCYGAHHGRNAWDDPLTWDGQTAKSNNQLDRKRQHAIYSQDRRRRYSTETSEDMPFMWEVAPRDASVRVARRDNLCTFGASNIFSKVRNIRRGGHNEIINYHSTKKPLPPVPPDQSLHRPYVPYLQATLHR
jgi:hypothetical protein